MPDLSNALRNLPSVHELLERLSPAARRFPRALVISEARQALAAARVHIQAGGEPGPLETFVETALLRLAQLSLRRVINATGVVLHTNLGRAPLGEFAPIPGFSNLEYDLASGRRGKRDEHCAVLLERLLGAPAIAVNNGAAAVYLALHELAANGEVIVSRGELIEIGDGFRIPDIMQHSGTIVREIGTTNRTRIEDYRNAISDRTKLILRVHPSNFKITGFTARPSVSELVTLSRESGIPLHEDLGSGCLVDLSPFGVREPLVQDSLSAGVNLVSFSGDKLLGGPQAGLLAGDRTLVERLRRNPMFRALRLDKLITQSLEATLRALLLEDWEKLPALRMIRLSAAEVRERAEVLRAQIPGALVEPGESVTGGGATPDQPLPTFLLVVPGNATARERQLRLRPIPVIARVEADRVLIDLRTVFPEEEAELLAALQALS